MRKRLTMIFAIAAALTVGIASIAGAFTTHFGNLELSGNASFSPKKLPKNKLSPLTLTVSGGVKTTDGTHPPALRELVIETDKNGTINAKGLPVCTAAKLNSQDTAHAKKACPDAIVGEGKTDVEIAFPEQAPIVAHSKLLAFNGGVKGGVTTIFVHAFLTVPVPAAVVTTVKVSKIHNGRYGTKSIASIPVIAGGSGSPISFSLKVGRNFTYKGKKQSYLLAKCPDGHLNGKATGIFADGSKLTGTVVEPCTPKG